MNNGLFKLPSFYKANFKTALKVTPLFLQTLTTLDRICCPLAICAALLCLLEVASSAPGAGMTIQPG